MLKNTLVTLRTRRLAVLLAVIAPMLLSACAIQPQTDEQRVIERALARWDAVIAGDVETAYEFFAPGYRSTHSLIDFAVGERIRRVKRTSAEYLEHTCEEARCFVTIRLGFTVYRPVPGMPEYSSTSKVEETWIKTRGEWWYLPKK